MASHDLIRLMHSLFLPVGAAFPEVCWRPATDVYRTATGWLGTKSYSDGWDGGAYWTHVGYPGDLTGGQRPTYQNAIALDGDFWTTDAHERISHRADIWPGQSGGPFWGYWDGAPYAVATQSGQTASENSASGGSDLVDLVTKARADFP